MAELSPAETDWVLRAERLGHRYEPPGQPPVAALTDVSFQLRRGERVAVVGATGSGKSTLVAHFNGLLMPTAGRLDILGERLEAGHPLPPGRAKALRFRVGLVFQSPEEQLFAETVAADVAFGPRNQGLPDCVVAARVDRALSQVGLDPQQFGSRSPWALSGGEQRRVALAGVLAMEPEILVLDEPTVGLDPAGRDALVANILSYNGVGGNRRDPPDESSQPRTVIVVTHDMELVLRLADRVLVLQAGRLVFDGDVGSLLATGEERLRSWGLVPPPLVQLVEQLRAAGWPVRAGCTRLSQVAAELIAAARCVGEP